MVGCVWDVGHPYIEDDLGHVNSNYIYMYKRKLKYIWVIRCNVIHSEFTDSKFSIRLCIRWIFFIRFFQRSNHINFCAFRCIGSDLNAFDRTRGRFSMQNRKDRHINSSVWLIRECFLYRGGSRIITWWFWHLKF